MKIDNNYYNNLLNDNFDNISNEIMDIDNWNNLLNENFDNILNEINEILDIDYYNCNNFDNISNEIMDIDYYNYNIFDNISNEIMDIDNCNNLLNENFDNILDIDIDNNFFIEKKLYSCEDFINKFPKEIFFLEKMSLFKFFLDKGYSFYSVNWIVYNQMYLCNIINHPNFNDFLSLLYERYKENVLFYSEDDILKFITDNKFNFMHNILNCNKFYENIDIEVNIEVDNLNIIKPNNNLEEVD
jgi:hypothetical protein